jgi:hypothetical protein
VDGGRTIEIDRPRSAPELIGATFALYRRYPWLFLVLAAVVVVPYQVIDLLDTARVFHGAARILVGLALTVADVALVVPLISALHVHAIDDVREGREPSLRPVARRGIATLPVLVPAAGIAWLGATAGLLLLIVPGVVLFLRWSVVAQAAALGSKNWESALRHSRMLTGGNYAHVFWLFVIVFAITAIPDVAVDIIFGLHRTTVPSFLVRTAIAVPLSSFTALAAGLLYFDLLARLRVVLADQRSIAAEPRSGLPDAPGEPTAARPAPPASGDPLNPTSWSDEDRPAGWYIDPERPKRMRYWPADGARTWSGGTTKTPQGLRRRWEARSGVDPNAWSDADRPAGWYVNPAQPKRMRYWPGPGAPAWSQQVKKTPKRVLVEWEQLLARRDEGG